MKIRRIKQIIAVTLAAGMLVSLSAPLTLSAAAPSEKDEKLTIESLVDEESLKAGDSQYGYRDLGVTIPSLTEKTGKDGLSRKQRKAIPGKYDAREKQVITSVKNQGDEGNCWAFAAASAGETNMIVKNKEPLSVDYSERQLVYFFFHKQPDPLGLTVGDSVLPFGDYKQAGGNDLTTVLHLATWSGYASEADAPYSQELVDKSKAYGADKAHLQNAYWIPMEDVSDVKNAIMEYGSVASGYFSNAAYYNTGSAATGTAFYYDGNSAANHEITIVGWDDNYAVSNFKSGKQPSNPGAWLVKNSWGKEAGENGYLWISYEDNVLRKDLATVYDNENADNYDHNYQHDGGVSLGGYSDEAGDGRIWTANVFEAKANPSGNEKLEAVSFFTNDPNTSYNVEIYKNVTGDSNPKNGEKAAVLSGTETYAGYHTVKLDTPILLTEGSKYSIVVGLSNGARGEDATIALCDYTQTLSGWIKTFANAQKGQSFLSVNGVSWSDMGESAGANARIKGFTSNTSEVEVKPEPDSGNSDQSGQQRQDQWILNSTGWWYSYADGSYPANGWASIGGQWYHFDAAGYMQTGWIYTGNNWYYLSGSGAMATGWLNLGGTWYYLSGSGAMATGWLNLGGTWYYLSGSGAMVTGWLYSNGAWYLLRGNGAMATGWVYPYYFDQSGAWIGIA